MSKCKMCGSEYQKTNISHLVCSYDCSLQYAMKHLSKKKTLKQTRAKKDLLKNDKSYWLRQAQTVVNKYIRIRDKNEKCISCDYDLSSGKRQVHCGHYIAQGKSSLLRFDERNLSGQCATCNTYLHGNLISYREKLIKKIGIKEVEYLEAHRHDLKRWTIEELKEIIETYKDKAKKLDINS